jgi:hypothetical protein
MEEARGLTESAFSGEGFRAYAYLLPGRGLHIVGFAVILDTGERRTS